MNSDHIPEIYDKISRGHFRCPPFSMHIKVTPTTKVRLKLVKSKTERYYSYAKFPIQFCKSEESPRTPWFLLSIFAADPPEVVKENLLKGVNNHHFVYNTVFEYVYDRCLETCPEKTLQVEIGRKHQPVSTNVLATEPFPAETLWIYLHFPESLRNKLNEWVNSSFKIKAMKDKIQVHSYFGETTDVLCVDRSKPFVLSQSRFDSDSRWMPEDFFANGPAVTDTDFTVELFFRLHTSWLHPDVFMPDYFTSIKPRPWTGEMIQVFSSSGDSSYCYVAAYKNCSPVLEAQVRWNTAKGRPLTLELNTEVFESLIEFINYSHITAATKSFKLAVQLLFAANKYDLKELQEKLLDLIYVLPFSAFDDTEALVELYLLLDVTRTSECVLKRIEGMIKLKASEIMCSPVYQDLEPQFKSNISSLISSYEVVLDIISLWRDNKHNTTIAEEYDNDQTMLEENARIQSIHKRKPWQLCCDYLNYCNFKTGGESDGPTGEKPKELIKIVREFHSQVPFPMYANTSFLVKETP